MKLWRTFTGPIQLYRQPDTDFCQRVEYALNELSWSLHGSPSVAFNVKENALRAAQPVTCERNGSYAGFSPIKEMPINPRLKALFYRLIVGDDDANFCKNIERALNDGWKPLGGPPYLIYNSVREQFIVAQAITKESDEAYREYIPTRQLLPHLVS